MIANKVEHLFIAILDTDRGFHTLANLGGIW
jgi:hypothetical protein